MKNFIRPLLMSIFLGLFCPSYLAYSTSNPNIHFEGINSVIIMEDDILLADTNNQIEVIQRIQIWDSNNNKVYDNTLNNNQFIFDLSFLNSDKFFVEILTSSNMVFSTFLEK